MQHLVLLGDSITFEYHYCPMLEAVLRLQKPAGLCTIYYPNVPEPFVQRIQRGSIGYIQRCNYQANVSGWFAAA